MLKYTGHPFLDVGTAVITVFSEKEKPEDLTQEDLVKIADFIKDKYPKNPVKGYLSMMLTVNSGYSNPSIGEAKREEYYNTYLYGFLKEEKLDKKCVFLISSSTLIIFQPTVSML